MLNSSGVLLYHSSRLYRAAGLDGLFGGVAGVLAVGEQQRAVGHGLALQREGGVCRRVSRLDGGNTLHHTVGLVQHAMLVGDDGPASTDL